MKVEILLTPELTEPVAQIKTNKVTPRIEAVKEVIEKEDFSTKISVSQGKSVLLLSRNKMQVARMELGKVVVYMVDGDWFEIKETLQELENLLGEQFVRISKSAIVNIDSIKTVKASFNGTMELYLENGYEEVISRTYRKQFKERLGVK